VSPISWRRSFDHVHRSPQGEGIGSDAPRRRTSAPGRRPVPPESPATQRVHTRLVTSVFSTGFLALIPALATNAPAAAQCGEPDGGDCCVPHTAVGCNDSACCTAVCNADPFCCEVGWDEYCAGEAVATCGCTPPDRQVVGFGATVTLPSGLVVEKHDLAIRDHQTGAWSIWLDGEDVGLSGTTIAGAAPLADGSILIVTAANGTLAGLAGGPAGGAYEAYDILRFTPTSLGATTAGTWSFHFDGSDVGLAGNTNRIIQSVSALADGSLVISVKGSTSVPGVSSVTAFDLLRFTPTSLGAATAGTWSKHFEGTDVGLSQNPEKLDNGWVRGDGSIVLSTLGNVNVTGFSGTKGDLFAFFPTSLGSVTAGSFAPFARLSELGLPSGVNLRAAFRMPVTYPTGPRPGGGGGGGGGTPTSCGAPGTSDCCMLSPTPYCADASCCEAVCAIDPICCAVAWDEFCVGAATQACPPCMPAPRAVMAFGATVTLPGDLVVNGCDLAAFDTGAGAWTTYFDGDDVGLSGKVVAAAALLPSGELVLAIDGGGSLADLANGPAGPAFDAWDLVRFTPTSLGDATAGAWSFHFDGSDVGLGANADSAIRSLGVMGDGSLLVATLGDASLPGVGAFKSHDLVRFVPTSLGANTAGAWSMHLDGSDVGLAHQSQERLDAGFPREDGSILLSTRGNLDANGFAASRGDLVAFHPASTGDATSGWFDLYRSAAQMGLPSGTNVQSAFVYLPVVTFTPRPTAPILFDRLPDAAIEDKFDQYLIIYQGVDPNAASTGLIDVDLVIAAIRSQYGDQPSGYGILDFENPFIARLEAGPTDPNWSMTVDTVVAALRAVKAEFPQVKWTMYGMPLVRFWLPPTYSQSWADASEPVREQNLNAILLGFDPVLRECDWFNPGAYDRYELALFSAAEQPGLMVRERAYREAMVEVLDRFNASSGLPRKPIIPMISPMFWKSGRIAYNMKQMGLEEFLRDSVRPLMLAGADGVAIWTGLSYWVRASTSAQNLGPDQADARHALTMDFLGGVTPADWTAPALHDDLALRTSQHVRSRLDEVRSEIQSMSLGNPGP
jgi:hypothetical protein